MTNFFNEHTKRSAVAGVLQTLGVALFFYTLNAFASWAPPLASPPGENVAGALNIGTSTQYKEGALNIGGKLRVYNNGFIDQRIGVGTSVFTNNDPGALITIAYPSDLVSGAYRSGITYITIDPEGSPLLNANIWNIGVDASGSLHIADAAGITTATNTPGGTRIMIEHGSGNVGMGVYPPDPNHNLDVAGKINTNDALCINGDCATSWGYVTGLIPPSMFVPSGSINQTMRFDGTNWVPSTLLYNTGIKVGIGTDGPQQLLQLERASSDVAVRFMEPSLGVTTMGIDYSDGSKFKINNDLTLDNDARNLLTIDTNGNVGVGGITSPGAKLSVAGSAYISGRTIKIGPDYEISSNPVNRTLRTTAPDIYLAAASSVLPYDGKTGYNKTKLFKGTDDAGQGIPDDWNCVFKPYYVLKENYVTLCPRGYEALHTLSAQDRIYPGHNPSSSELTGEVAGSSRPWEGGELVCCNMWDGGPAASNLGPIEGGQMHTANDCTIRGGTVESYSSPIPTDPPRWCGRWWCNAGYETLLRCRLPDADLADLNPNCPGGWKNTNGWASWTGKTCTGTAACNTPISCTIATSSGELGLIDPTYRPIIAPSCTYYDMALSGTCDTLCSDTGAPVITQADVDACTLPIAAAPDIAGRQPIADVIADFNGDGINDLAVAFDDKAIVTVYIGNAGGTFFGPSVNYTVVGVSSDIVAADFDGDGAVDLAVAAGRYVSVLINNGDGIFASKADYNWGTDTWGDTFAYVLVAGDLNGDGRADLVSTRGNNIGGFMNVLINNGDGTFAAKVGYPTGPYPTKPAIGNVGGDGRADIVVPDYFSYGSGGGGISVFINNGDGTFAARVGYGTEHGESVSIADLNNDTHGDIIINSAASYKVVVVLNDGDGTFDGNSVTAPQGDLKSVAIGYFNADGRKDIATISGSSSVVYLFTQNVSGTFTLQGTYPVGNYPNSIVAANLDGNGYMDLVVQHTTGISVMLNSGGTNFSRTDYAPSPGGTYPSAVAVGDLTGNVRDDIAVTSYGGSVNLVSVLINRGDGNYFYQTDYTTGSLPFAVAIGHVGGSNMRDVVVANYGAKNISVFINNSPAPGALPNPSFAAKVDYTPADWHQMLALALGDINGDGRNDVVTGDSYVGGIEVFPNNGTGGFPSHTDYDVGAYPSNVALDDFDHVGGLDVVYGNRDVVSVLMNTGGGSFSSPVDYTVAGSVSFVAAGDINGDGWSDIVVSGGSANITILMNNGNGTFTDAGSSRVFTTASEPRGMAVKDLNNDSRPDLAVGNNLNNFASVFLNSGTGGIFSARTDYDTGPIPGYITAGDLNGDLSNDIIALSDPYYANNFSVLSNNGSGTFTGRVDYMAGYIPGGSVVYGQLNNDTRMDVARINSSTNTLSVSLNNGNGTFTTTDYATQPNPVAVITGDMNNDGRQDIVVANQDLPNLTFSVFINNGSGTFAARVNYFTGLTYHSAYGLATGNLNNAGGDEVVLRDADSFLVFMNSGGTFGSGVRYYPYPAASSLRISISDQDGNGTLDVWMVNSSDNAVVSKGRGDGTFLTGARCWYQYSGGATGTCNLYSFSAPACGSVTPPAPTSTCVYGTSYTCYANITEVGCY